MTSFIVWTVLFLSVVATFFWHAKKSRHIDAASEDIAATALPTIGGIAERQHVMRFGRPPTDTNHRTGSWYPPTRAMKHRRGAPS